MDKYEISLWEDFVDQTSSGKSFLNERKIAIIGSDTMKANNIQARALEPNLIEELNGTHTFTFKMYYTYTDNQTGEKYENPYGKYLINERKIKVFWKNEWYDLVIKKCQEDTSKKIITYTCTDLCINELSKQGYSLEFSTELQNNIGTAGQLATAVLDGSTWQYSSSLSTPIIQKTEGPVYEVTTANKFNAIKQNYNGDTSISIPAGKVILLFYDSIVNILNTGGNAIPTQFLYSSNGYITDVNDVLVTNGDCYLINLNWSKSGSILTGKSGTTKIVEINISNGVSERYRAERLVKSKLTEYDPLLDRYVQVCTNSSGKIVYEIATTEYTDPLSVVNLVANPNNFANTSGWINVGEYGLYPKFTSSSNISTYSAKSYLKINSGNIYNSGIQSNINYFKPTEIEIKEGKIGGIQKNEKYIFRVKAKTNSSNTPGSYITSTTAVKGNLYKYTTSHAPSGSAIFTQQSAVKSGDWIEYTLICNTPISATNINQYGLFLISTGTYWIEDVQFFKYAEGITSYSDTTPRRMNPGEINLQSIVKPVYKYYLKNTALTSAEQITYLYVGDTEQSSTYPPSYNNYEKIGTIQEKESNRFNILQSIAETFQAWVKFKINHTSNGTTIFTNGVPQKYVYFVSEVGQETGISFEYGIDLKTISRTIDSDKIATKIIVNPNTNEFGKNGFCSIARSDQNYIKENFILNLDYYTQQNLLDKTALNKDLYSTQSGYVGYYYNLHAYNKEYDSLIDELTAKKIDLTKQEAEKEVYNQYLLAAQEQLENIESDLINLAGVSSWAAANTYAKNHTDNEKVQSLLNTHGQVAVEIANYKSYVSQITSTIATLKNRITAIENRQKTLLTAIKNIHKDFNNKYTTYLMEGTWQDDNYVNDDEYYLDALKVAYTSSRPQLSYSINVLRLSSLEDYSSKVFNLGDICYMQDREFFGYLSDKITPYKEKILVSKISSFFDQPEKDIITVQNYKTRFDDLFQRIAATTQSLSYSEGSFTRAAETFNTDGTVKFAALQDTFDKNADLILNSSNQDVTWDNTGITVTNKFNSADKTKIIAGGIFVTNDGGTTWKNAVRGDGISTDLLDAGRVNTSKIYIYDGNAPSFRWDSDGLTAYSYTGSTVNFGKFVRHDKYGFYGYEGSSDFIPANENAIWNNAKFGMTWKGFFLKGGKSNTGHFEISDSGSGINFTLSNANSNSGLYIKATNTGIDFKLNGIKDNNGLQIISDTNGTTFKLIGGKNGTGLTISADSKGAVFSLTDGDNKGNTLEISTENHIRIMGLNNKGQAGTRVKIGRWSSTDPTYGLWIMDKDGNSIFRATTNNSDGMIGGWTLNKNSLYHTDNNSNTIGLFSEGKSAKIQGHTDNYYIIAGNNFGVTSDGHVYANAGTIGGWTINESSLSHGSSGMDSSYHNKDYVEINSNGTLKGQGYNDKVGNFSWNIGATGFTFNGGTKVDSDSDVVNQIILGPTTINNKEIYTDNISAHGGSIDSCTIGSGTIGGCSISSEGISGTGWSFNSGGGSIGGCSISSEGITGGGWSLSSSGLTLSGTTVQASSTDYVKSVSVGIAKDGSTSTDISVTGYVPEGGGTVTLYGSVNIPNWKITGGYTQNNASFLRTLIGNSATHYF